MNHHALEQTAKTLLAAVITEGRWETAIETMMSSMNVLGGGIARVVPPKMFAIPSSGVSEQFSDVRAGKTPRLTSRTSLRPQAGEGFIADHIAIPQKVRHADVFYQEFLRPRGCVYKTSALLDQASAGAVDAIIYRTERQGPFQPEEIRSLDVMLPYLRSAAIVARGALWNGARVQADGFERRGEPVIYLGPDGRVIEVNPAAGKARGDMFEVVDRRLTTIVPADQPRLDRALTTALSVCKPALVTLTSFAGTGQTMALVLPVLGHARDVFEAASVMVVLLDADHQPSCDEPSLALLRDAGGLTGREFDVVRLVVAGSKPREAADQLGIGAGTARLHLKASFAKLGVHSQGELSRLVRRLS